MEQSAIKELKIDGAIENINRYLDANEDLKNLVAIPGNIKVESLERFMPNRSRFRGDMKTHSVDDFCGYIKYNAEAANTCFINQDTMKAVHIFNIGNAGHCDSTATLSLKPTAAFSAMMKINGAQLSQRDAAEFIEDYRAHIGACTSSGETINLSLAIEAIRKISINQKKSSESDARNFGASKSSMESIDLANEEKFPAFFCYSCEPYLGLPKRDFVLRVGTITSEPPKIVLQIVQQEQHTEEMARDFKNILIEKLANIEPKVETYLGEFHA